MSEKNKANLIEINRVYEASLKDVWDAWTDPKKAAKWWGPRGYTITTHSKNLKVGGEWHYTMHGPDGIDYENKTKYLEVENYSRLVYDHGGNDDRPPLFRVTVNFSEINGKTKMEMTMALATPEAAAQTKKFIKAAGGNATWDRLAEFLSNESTGKEFFFINRSFEADLKTFFEAWTNPSHFSKWLAPKGFEMKFLRADISTNGSTFYCMFNEGIKMYGRAHYTEVIPNKRLVYTQQFCDENENVSRHPMAPTWPETMKTIVTFSEEGPNQTRITVQWEPFGNFNGEELETFIKGKSGMTLGWTGSFDKLEDYLSAL